MSHDLWITGTREARASRSGRHRGTMRAVVVRVLIIGILGMHGLATHGSAAAAPSPDTPIGGQTSSHGMTMVGTVVTETGERGGPSAASTAPADTGSSHHALGAATWCALLLMAVALMFSLLLAVRAVLRLLPDAFQPVRPTATLGPLLCATGPPHEWEFSVTRC